MADGTASIASSTLYYYTLSVGENTTPAAVLFDGQYIWVAVEQSTGGALEKFSVSGEAAVRQHTARNRTD